MRLTNFRTIRTKAGYAPWLADLAGAHGVYIIRQRARGRRAALILYVGESHTHRLRETLQRHYQQWTGQTAGPTFEAKDTEVAIQVFLLGDDAIREQNRLIRRYQPLHNVQVPAPEADPGPKRRGPKKRASDDGAYDELAAFFDELST